MTDLRTAIRWLLEHELAETAEVWVLAKPVLRPVVAVEPVAGDTWLGTAPVWSEPTPAPLQWDRFYDRLMECYAAGGTFRWAQHPELVYRGSYVVNPASAVFLLFLKPDIELVQSHSELMEQRKEQANQLTQEIQDPIWQR